MARRDDGERSGRTLARASGWLPGFRLRYKLAALLSITALLPVVIASWIAVSVLLRNLGRGLRDDTLRQLDVGVNLVLHKVRRIGDDTVRLSSNRELAAALATREGDPGEQALDVLARESPYLPASLVQVTDAAGAPIAAFIVGGVASRFDGLHVEQGAPSVAAALSYDRRLTIVAIGDVLAVRAAAPVVDDSYALLGVIVVTVPLDGPFADDVKGSLGTDVLIASRAGDRSHPELSTFFDAVGVRQRGLVADDLAGKVRAGQPMLANQTVLGREYAVGYAALTDLTGREIGIFAVAVDRAPLLSAQRAATRSLSLGAAGAFVFALALAGLLSRRLTGPLARLHRGAIAVARGDLDSEIRVTSSDEIGDLAVAFAHMTQALKENQARLAARIREIVALHDAGRAVSSVIDLDAVLKKIVDSVARVFDVRLCALWLVEARPDADAPDAGDPADTDADTDAGAAPALRIGAARALTGRGRGGAIRGERAANLAAPLGPIAASVAAARATVRVDPGDDTGDDTADDTGDDAEATTATTATKLDREAAIAAGITGSLLATPLERKSAVIGVLIVGRGSAAKPFTEADANLLATFADQAAAAVENARLYQEVRTFNVELERKVEARTAELTEINEALEHTLAELGETQSQLILSERLAGLGMLVAGVAHEINSPSAAIRGSIDALNDNLIRLAEVAHDLATLPLAPTERDRALALATDVAPELAEMTLGAPVEVRRSALAMRDQLTAAGVDAEPAADAGRALAELGAPPVADEIAALIRAADDADARTARARVLPSYLSEHVRLHRNARTIRNAITRIQRIVRSLKTYSHLDQEADLVQADLHAGIDDTLAILDYVTRDINVVREYDQLPSIPVYVDELNQVWTNLIQNAAQALGGRGQIVIETVIETGIETAAGDDGVTVRVIDDGPGIPDEVRERIFEPFFTTKPKGEGTGLGLGIARQIVDKHHGRITCESRPGRTCFEVWLPRYPPGAPGTPGTPGTSPRGADDAGADS